MPTSWPCLPITPDIFARMREVWAPTLSEHNTAMLWAGQQHVSFLFFRAGELTVPSQAAFDSAMHLAWGDIAVDEGQPPPTVRYVLKRSKTDQFWQGMAVFMGATRNELCPVRATIVFVVVRGDAPGLFFCFEDGTTLTKARFVMQVREALDHVGVPRALYSGHSFRIGAAMMAARVGIKDSTIQAPGRWTGMTFLRYVRTPRDALAQYSRSLSRT